MTDHYPEYDVARGQRLAALTPPPAAVPHDAPHTPPPTTCSVPTVHASNLRGGTACTALPAPEGDVVRATLNPELVDCPPCKARLAAGVDGTSTTLMVIDELAAVVPFSGDGTFVEYASRQVQTAHGLVSLVLTCYWPNAGMAPARNAQTILDDLDTTQWSHE